MSGNTQRIAEYIAAARTRALPEDVADAARLCLADWLGVALGALEEPAARSVAATGRAWASAGRSTVLCGGGTAAAPVAALCNGTLAHCLDFDDTYVKGNTHISAPVWAAVLAVAEECRASEAQALRAFAAGFEAAARAGCGLGEAVTARGWHCTGVFGRIGAAAASAVLLGLDAGQVLHALGAAATQAGGLTASFGTMAKPFHAGKAAMDGVLAAQLAANGFRAATAVLEPGGGLDNALVQDGAARIVPADFSRWEILQNSFKPYAACHLAHPAIEAARKARAGLAGRSMRTIDVEVGMLAKQVTGDKSGRPRSALDGKFDLKYCVALALHGHSLSAADFREPMQVRPEIADSAAKVQVRADPAIGYTAARLRIETTQGAPVSAEVPVAKGHPGNPMRWEDMREKFLGLVDAARRPLFERVRAFGEAREADLLRS